MTEYFNYKNVLLELLALASTIPTLSKIFKTIKLVKVNDILKLQELKINCIINIKTKNCLIICKLYLSKIILVSIFMQQEYNTKFNCTYLITNMQKSA